MPETEKSLLHDIFACRGPLHRPAGPVNFYFVRHFEVPTKHLIKVMSTEAGEKVDGAAPPLGKSIEMPKDASCFLCDKQMSRQALRNHYFSRQHKGDLEAAIVRSRKSILSWIADVEAGKRVKTACLYFKEGAVKSHRMCFGCRYLHVSDHTVAHLPHVCEGDSIKVSLAYYKSVLERDVDSKQVMTVPSVAPEEVTKLKGKVEILKKTIRGMQDDLDNFDTMRDTLADVLKIVARRHREACSEALKKLVLNDIDIGYFKKDEEWFELEMDDLLPLDE